MGKKTSICHIWHHNTWGGVFIHTHTNQSQYIGMVQALHLQGFIKYGIYSVLIMKSYQGVHAHNIMYDMYKKTLLLLHVHENTYLLVFLLQQFE